MLRAPLPSLLLGAAAIVVALVFAAGSDGPDTALGQAPDGLRAAFELAIDADVENGDGPCDPIDDEVSVEEGAVHQVAVCILNPPEAPSAFLTRILYDGSLNLAPEMSDVLPALDDNPDANAGETTFSSPDLGARWNCSGLGIYPPRGDDEHTPEKFDAVLACNADLRDPDATLAESGPLQVITFEVIAGGDDHIEFDPQTQIGGAFGAIGRCGEVPAEIIPCRGAVIHKAGEAPPAEAPSEGGPEAPSDASPGAAAPEEAAPTGAETTAEADDDGGFPWAVAGGALGGAVVLIVVVAGLYTRRRASGPRP